MKSIPLTAVGRLISPVHLVDLARYINSAAKGIEISKEFDCLTLTGSQFQADGRRHRMLFLLLWWTYVAQSDHHRFERRVDQHSDFASTWQCSVRYAVAMPCGALNTVTEFVFNVLWTFEPV